jgi:hypothetical protein
MKTHIRLVRTVARASLACAWCRYPLIAYDAVYSPTVDGVALARYCSSRCAEWNTTAALEVAYQ